MEDVQNKINQYRIQLTDTDDARHHVERVILVGQSRIVVQVLLFETSSQLIVEYQFHGIHSRSTNFAHCLGEFCCYNTV
jgi:hypothetical protein